MWRKLLMGLGGVVGLAVVGLGVGYVAIGSMASSRLAKTWPEVVGKDLPIPFPLTEAEVETLRAERRAAAAAAAPPVDPAAPPADPAAAPVPEVDPLAGVDLAALALERAVARGEALVHGRVACVECHGSDGAGTLVADAQPVWTWYAPNITSGGVAKGYTGADWDRIIRHGVKKDGSTATMPSIDFMQLSDQEVSDVAAYFTSRPAVAAPQPSIVVGPVGKALLAFGVMPLSAELIDHSATHREFPPNPAVDLEFGKHVAATCAGCHRPGLNGGPIKQGPPDWPPAANLTPAEGVVAGYTEETFLRLFREGTNAAGTPVREPMSWMTKMKVTDTEILAMFLYLKSVPATPTGE